MGKSGKTALRRKNMADNNICTVEANGTTLMCSCGGCGIAYNHDTKKYVILCCGTITEMNLKNQTDDTTNPPKPNHIMVDLAGVTVLEAARLLDRAAPGTISINASFKLLKKKITLKANQPLSDLTKKLGIHSGIK
jgi:hypothetical protein